MNATVKNWLIVAGLGLGLTILSGIWYNTKDYPQVKEKQVTDKAEVLKMINDFMTKQENININHNTRIFNLEMWKRDDSVKKSTYQQIRSKPSIQFDELKGMKTK